MKKLLFSAFLILVLSATIISCNDKDYTKDKAGEETKSMDPAADLWSRISGYQNWSHWPGKQPFYKGTEPHGFLLSTYLNEPAYKALTGGSAELPYGSIVIKENYKPDKTLAAVTVMERIKGYNPDAGDWYWAKYKADGSLHTKEVDGKAMKLAGKVGGCIGCHTASTSGVKYIMTPK
ncbi:MAG: hypothetical protein GTO02_04490 [Candidatus Dadabacteria bacterium]|nr:hypothetical protein [Candidatus Dadabacteria bacterium]NIQ13678.1 hypothetical protein [Candidatus Dadabacteria bacterium]